MFKIILVSAAILLALMVSWVVFEDEIRKYLDKFIGSV